MLKKLLYGIVGWIARLHGYILRLNDASEYTFSDKALHFLVMGILGMALVFLLYPLFRYLARRRHEFTITWIYVFTLIVVITFAIEIGQYLTRTGRMELGDVASGMQGFLTMFGAYLLIRWAVRSWWNVVRACTRKLIQRRPVRL